MCGIIGIASKFNNGLLQDEIKIFTEMLFTTQLRGTSGTGIFYNNKKGTANIKTNKTLDVSSEFIYTKIYKEATETLFKESNFAIGHCRAATKGKLDLQCTHPFREQHITGVHNGTLWTHKNLAIEAKMDSHAIFISLSKNGDKETIKNIDGAFALAWFNGKEKTINLCRNKERSLTLFETNHGWIWCSEEKMGDWILDRNNEQIKSKIQLEPGTLYKLPLSNMTKWIEEKMELFIPFKNDYSKTNWYDNDDWKYTPNKHLPTTINKIKKFSFGQSIRFRTSGVKSSKNGKSFYLEGDILKNQETQHSYIFEKLDYEEKWRVRVWGGKAYLQEFANNKDIKGTINATPSINKEEPMYSVSQLSKIETEAICPECKGPLYPKVWYQGQAICEQCHQDLLIYQSCGTYGA